MKRKGLILVVLAAIVAVVMGLAACNGKGNAPAKYTVTFETNGGSAVAAVTVDKGGSVNLPMPFKPDYTFVGWFNNVDLTGDRLSSPYFPTANVILYAKWRAGADPNVPKEQYTITFVTLGGLAVEPMTAYEGSGITLPTPTKTNYTFVGWFNNADLTGDRLSSPYFPTANVTLYAKWKESDIIDGFTNNKYFTFEDIKGDNDSTIGYSVSLAAGKVPAKIIVPNSYNDLPVLTIKDFTNESITETVIPDSVTEIESAAFKGCSGLTSVTIGSGVKTIGSWAFEYCSGLTSVTIGSGVTSIDAAAFRRCSGLTSIKVAAENTVYKSSGNCLIEIATKTLIAGCNTSVIPTDGSVTSIGDYAFTGRSGLTSITIPDSVTSIVFSAFVDCFRLIEVNNLSSLTITAGSTRHGYVAYYAENVYTSSNGASKITTKDGYIFYNRYGSYCLIGYNGTDNALTLPDEYNGESYSIYDYAFYNCSGLTSVTIGSGVISIGYQAFYNCSGLTSIKVAAENTVYKSSGNCLIKIATKTLIAGCNTSVIPTDGSVTSIGDYAFSGCSGLTSVTIPDTVTSIGDYAFSGCSGLTSVTIPDTVTSIGDYAFSGCSGLTSVTIGSGVKIIGDYAFQYCRKLTSITFNGTKAQWRAIRKDLYWADKTPSFTVACTDGTLTKWEAGA